MPSASPPALTTSRTLLEQSDVGAALLSAVAVAQSGLRRPMLDARVCGAGDVRGWWSGVTLAAAFSGPHGGDLVAVELDQVVSQGD